MDLTIDLIPRSSWGNNVRSMVTAMEWDIIRHECYRRGRYVCAVCGNGGRMHCHEVFEYRDPDQQILVDLSCLCTNCHEVKHYGRATVVGREKEAKEWLQKVNSWNEFEAQEHKLECFLKWHRRNKINWQLDISYLHKFMKDTV